MYFSDLSRDAQTPQGPETSLPIILPIFFPIDFLHFTDGAYLTYLSNTMKAEASICL